MQRDYYQVLGVGPDADDKEIKKAYRTIIRYCHPDSPDCRMTKDELLEVQEAYETLADPQKRARYDRGRNAPRQGHTGRAGGPAGARRGTPRGSFTPDDMFSDIFSLFRDPFFDSPFFGLGGRDFASEPGLEITLSATEARQGGSFEIAIPGPGGIPTGTIVIRVAPGVRSGTETTVDLREMLGVRRPIRITIVVEDDGR
ncbi:MAG: DnaJ domain-containing protein [Deltaproteobacteria bacterium]|nr:DnaJ domain-containing protein [Candidatus Zymogenaceae bacterium]